LVGCYSLGAGEQRRSVNTTINIMDAKIDQVTSAEREWISQQIAAAKKFVSETIGENATELPSPEKLDQAFDAWLNSVSHEPNPLNKFRGK